MRGTSPSGSSTARCAPAPESAVDGHAAAARRQLADLPRVLRAADRHGDRQRAGHQRGVRLHVDADQPAAGPPARRRAWWPSTGPSRRSATRPSPTYKANREAAPDILRQQMGLVREVRRRRSASPSVELRRLRGRRHHRHARRAGQAARATTSIIVTGDRDTYQLVRGPARQGALQPARRVRLRAVRRGRHPGADRRDAGAVPRVRGAARRPVDNLPGVPGVGEKTAAKLITTYGGLDGDLRPRRRADAEAAGLARRARGPGAARTPR